MMEHNGDDTMGRILDDLDAASRVPAKRRGAGLKTTVSKLASAAYEDGLLPEELTQLLNLITHPSHLDQGTLASLIRSLYPAAGVSAENVLSVVGCLGHGKLKPALNVQSHLLQWLILVYHVLEAHNVLVQAYAVLFNLLNTAALRPQLCHVLALITRRKHVQPFRIQSVMALARQTNDPSILGLLRVYKNYYPEIIVGTVTKGRASAFKHPDPAWREHLDQLQAAHARREHAEQTSQHNGFRVQSGFGGRRARQNGVVPIVHTTHATESSITLEEVDNAEQFAANLEIFELPSQMAAVLADPLLQKLTLLRPQEEAQARLDAWLSGCLQDVISGETDEKYLSDILEAVRTHAESVKDLSDPMLVLLKPIVENWSGGQSRQTVFDIYSFLSPDRYHTARGNLEIMENRVLRNRSPSSLLAVLSFYTLLLRRWSAGLSAMEAVTEDAATAVKALIDRANELCLSLISAAPTTSTHFAILDFYDQLTTLFPVERIVRYVQLVNLPTSVVYSLLFSPSLAVVSRLCGVLTAYKLAWERIMSKPGRQLSTRERQDVSVFNGFLMDVCNCIWRGRAFALTDPNAQGCGIPARIVPPLSDYLGRLDSELALNSAFTLSNSPSICLQSISYLRALEVEELAKIDSILRARHAGPVTQNSLAILGGRGGLDLNWQEYRTGVLMHLQDLKLEGIPDLMKITMKQLMNSRN